MGAVLRHIAHKRKRLPIEAARSQSQNQRARAYQRHHSQAQVVGGTDQGGTGVGHSRHTCFAEQTDVKALQRGLKQSFGVPRGTVVAFFVHFSGQFNNALRLQSGRKRFVRVNAFKQSPCRFGVFTHPM